jgi:hypothetical protein
MGKPCNKFFEIKCRNNQNPIPALRYCGKEKGRPAKEWLADD